jgi:tetratricopeptide (TPR) repeat protein
MDSFSIVHSSFDRGEFAQVETALASLPQRTCAENVLLSRAYLRLGRADDATRILTQAAADNPGEAEPQYYLGCALGRLKQCGQATDSFRRALTLGHEKARLQYAHALLRMGRLDEAAAEYEIAAANGSGSQCAEAFERLGMLSLRYHRPLHAARMLGRALIMGRNSDTLLWELGLCMFRLGRFSESIERWSELSRRHPANARLRRVLRQVVWLAGLSSLQAGDADSALRYFASLAADGPVNKAIVECHFRAAAKALAENGDRARTIARRHLEAAYRLRLPDDRIEYYHALLAADSFSSKTAAEILRKSSMSRPRFALGAFLHQAGQPAEARVVWQELSAGSHAGKWPAAARLALLASLVQEGEIDQARALDPAGRLANELICGRILRFVRANAWSDAAGLLLHTLAKDPEGQDRMQHDTRTAAAVAVVCVMGGKRQQATDICERARRGDLKDHTITHFLFASGYWAASRIALDVAPQDNGENEQHWRQVSENATLLLNAGDYCSEWCTTRSRVYEVTYREETVSAFQQAIEQRLLERLPISSGAGMGFRIELNGARALQALGGLPIPDPRAQPVICGPAMLRRLSLAGALGLFVRDRVESRVASLSKVGRIMRYYSSLARATTMLEFGRPRVALQALESARCEACAAAPPGLDPRLPRLCRPGCMNFAFRNPAYSQLDRGAERLFRDAVELAADASIAIADGHIASGKISTAAVSSAWSNALFFAQSIDVSASMEGTIAHRVQASSWSLLEKERFDEAVDILEAAYALRLSFRTQLAGKLAEALNYRGVHRADATPPDTQAAYEDFQRSVSLNPYVPGVWRNLLLALRDLAINSGLPRAGPLLIEARGYLAKVRDEFPSESWLDDVTGSLETSFRRIAYDLNELGLSTAAESLFKNGADLLRMASELAPDVEELRQNFCKVSTELALALFRSGRVEEARQVLREAYQRCPDNPEVLAAKNAIS